MKKSLFALLFVVALVVPALAENMWVGGEFSYDHTGQKGEDSTSSFYIAPEFGYNLNEKFDIGLEFFCDYDDFGEDSSTRFGIAPFVRYKIFEIKNFDFLVRGKIYYESTNYDKSDATINSYGIVIVPIVSYSINERWSISVILDFARLWFDQYKHDGDYELEETTFYLEGNKGTLFSIGFSYHF